MKLELGRRTVRRVRLGIRRWDKFAAAAAAAAAAGGFARGALCAPQAAQRTC